LVNANNSKTTALFNNIQSNAAKINNNILGSKSVQVIANSSANFQASKLANLILSSNQVNNSKENKNTLDTNNSNEIRNSKEVYNNNETKILKLLNKHEEIKLM
jgi:hypothetical protein